MNNDTSSIIYLVALLVLVGAGVFTRQNASKSVRDLLIWAGVILVLILGYDFYQKMITRPTQLENGNMSVRIPYDDYAGGYRVRFKANGADIDGIIDTGATSILLTFQDAEAAGLKPEELRYTVEMSTANGSTYAAPAQLDRMAFGEVVFYDVKVFVSRDGDVDVSLLGMPVLRRAKSFSANRNMLFIEF